ncbi:MAG: TonB-dependent receptor [Acidobacteriota bacterium]|nr:TonB-dependent receptor [Acidobacteriota bacterium]
MNRFYVKRNLLSGIAMLLLLAAGARGQTGTTSVRGTVTDESGAAAVGSTVTLKNSSQGIVRDVKTTDSGQYEFLLLPPGTYVLTVEGAGFRKFEQTNLQLLVGNPATVDVVLQIGSTNETVEVNAEQIALNTTDASLGIAFNETQVKQLPLEGRNVPDLLSLQAGVVYTGNRTDINQDIDTRSGSVNGARSDQSNVTLDGIAVNDAGGHAFKSVLPVTLDSVQEFRVTTTNYNAEQGGSSGAQVQLVTKSGTDAFHGSAYEYLRNTYTSANDFFVKNAELSQGQPNIPPKLIRNVFGGSLGGPIVKKRFYFFLNYEGTRRAEESSAVRAVPTDALRAGFIQYLCATPSDCPGGQQLAVANSAGQAYNYTVPAGYMALDSAQITGMDPQGLGPNPAVLSYFGQYPSPNDTTVGDGVNFSGFRFRAPVHDIKNWYIAKMDFNITRDAKHRVSVSGALANEANPGVPFLPGNAPENTFLDFSKGLIANYSGVLTNTLVNNFRYGYIRTSYGNAGNSDQPWILFRSIDQGITRSSVSKTPTHNFSDDLSWTKGRHSLQFGTALSFISNSRFNTLNSFSDGVTNGSWLDTAGFIGTSSPFDPANNGYPAADPSFANGYDFPLIALLGMVTEDDATYNYLKDGSVLPQGAPVSRHFAARSYEFYGQDSWKVKPNLTVTYGLRYSLFPAPWETNGLQVAPNIPLGQWFDQRATNMLNGVPSNQDPLVSFDLSGPANGGKPGLYKTDKHNFAPRVAIAWSPTADSGLFHDLFGDRNKTTIRAGFGMVYDRISTGLLDTFDSRGSFGLSSTLTNPAGVESADCAPRLTSLNEIPTTDACGNNLLVPAPPGQFPQTFPSTLDSGGFCICWGLDNGLKSPYSYTLDFSVGRELPGGFSVEVSYVGRLSHRLLAQEDLAMPLNFVDKTSKVDYFSAATALAKLYRQGIPTASITPALVGSTAPYWNNVLQPLQPGGAYSLFCSGGSTTDPLQAAYDLFGCFSLNETTALFVLDYFGIPDANDPNTSYFASGGANTFFNPQFSSLYAWRSNTNANYHAMEVNVRHRMSHGIQFDFNYTFSKSIDIMSDATRIGAWGGLGGQIINSWSPNQLRAPSDFDARHQFNANWIIELPFGRGRYIGRDTNRALDAVIGGWQLSGLFRMTSGFPVNIFGGFNWPTNWQLGGNALLTSPVKTGTFDVLTGDDAGNKNLFANGPDAINSFTAPFPGQSGARNQIRGDGFFGVDLGLAKRWKMPFSEKQSLQFRWEVFNVTNSKRFNTQSNPPELDISTTFGNYTGLLTNPRVMQFALRYEF